MALFVANSDALVIKVLWMIGLGEKKPTFDNQAGILNQKCQDKRAAVGLFDAGPEEQQGQEKSQQHENPFNGFHEQSALMMEKVAGIDRATHEAHGFLLDLIVAYADGRLHAGFVFNPGVA